MSNLRLAAGINVAPCPTRSDLIAEEKDEGEEFRYETLDTI